MRSIRCPVFFLLLTMTGVPAWGADWNQWRGPNRDGVAPDSPALVDRLPSEGLEPAWVSADSIPSARDGGWAAPIIVGDRVFLYAHTRTKLSEADLPKQKYPYLSPDKRVGMSEAEFEAYETKRRAENFERAKAYRFGEMVLCLDVASGKTIWKFEAPSIYTRWPQSDTPAIHDGKLYLMGAARTARCIDTETGRELWSTKLPGEFRDEFYQSSFVIVDGVAAALAGYLFGVDAEKGDILWTGNEKSTSGVHCSPVVWRSKTGPRVIVNVEGRETVCVEPRTGRELWRVKSEAGHSTPIVIGDRLITFGNSRKSGLRAYDLSDAAAELKWTYRGAADPGSTPVAVNGNVYVQGEKRLACVDLETGKEKWMTLLNMSNPRYASLVAADGKVFYAWEGLLMFAADPAGYRPLASAKFNAEHLMAEEATFRAKLGIDELNKTTEGQKKAEQLWRSEVGKHGPLKCITPTLADGRMYLRTNDRVVCYDLRKER
jgi:outer membrane protein assembly factor BamB